MTRERTQEPGTRRQEGAAVFTTISPTGITGSAGTAPSAVAAIEGSRAREHLSTVVVPDADNLGPLIADRIVETIEREVHRKGRCVLGLATGSTPLGVYRVLIQRYEAGEVDFARVISFNLDEYYPMSPENPHSYHRYMWENLFAHVNIDPSNVHIPDGSVPRERAAETCAAFDQAIAQAGGIDFQILGIGKSGHIGFNEPGSRETSRTRLVTLDTLTRKDASADFFGEDNVPREALTMGVATILEAREIALIAAGEHKAAIVQRAVEGEITQTVAATFLQRHPRATVYLDLAAAAELTRIKTPWVLEAVEWTAEMIERAVVWLAEQSGKAILKLSAADYAENHLSPLLAKFGSPGPVNGEVFNQLKDKIRGRSKLPAGKRVVVFSPHPDDDVISMGGTLRKLRENDNHLVVAYMTSGNIAVFDDDVRRLLDFTERVGELLGLEPLDVGTRRAEIETALARKTPGDIDIPAVQELKRAIRESEAIAALRSMGIAPRAARFLDMPFYRTGEVRKHPISEDDVNIVLALLDEIRPDYVFVAGDLSDPHGTHRMCLKAIDSALSRYQGSAPEVWLYRGAWAEWSLTEADVLVPLSHEEVHAKIAAIFNHESQKDSMPFPGGLDDREFWQRVEARNCETAARADRLGLPEYYAMEAYVVRPHEHPAAPSTPAAS
jgi:glucosamine-6-phosphate deaminase